MKIFEKTIDSNLTNLSNFLLDMYSVMEEMYQIDENDSFVESSSLSTIKWKEYNVFQFNNKEIYDLFVAVKELAAEVFEHYNIDAKKSRYMIQGWFNINSFDSGKLDWHRHVPESIEPNTVFHGYYGVNIDNSSTYYLYNDSVVENKNKNNKLILADSLYPHAMGDWSWEGKRISIAYDIFPLNNLLRESERHQHWIPLVP